MNSSSKSIFSPGIKAFCTFPSPFTNTEGILITYDDIVRARDLNLLMVLKDNEECKKIFEMRDVSNLSYPDLLEWYSNRKYKDLMSNFNIYNSSLSNDDFLIATKEITIKEYDEIPLLPLSKLEFFNSLKMITTYEKSLTGSLFVYTEVYSKIVETDLNENFGDRVNYVYGDLKDVIHDTKLNSNSSYVFSNINYIETLKEMDILKYSSILLASSYAYNDYSKLNNYGNMPVKIFLFNALLPITVKKNDLELEF